MLHGNRLRRFKDDGQLKCHSLSLSFSSSLCRLNSPLSRLPKVQILCKIFTCFPFPAPHLHTHWVGFATLYGHREGIKLCVPAGGQGEEIISGTMPRGLVRVHHKTDPEYIITCGGSSNNNNNNNRQTMCRVVSNPVNTFRNCSKGFALSSLAVSQWVRLPLQSKFRVSISGNKSQNNYLIWSTAMLISHRLSVESCKWMRQCSINCNETTPLAPMERHMHLHIIIVVTTATCTNLIFNCRVPVGGCCKWNRNRCFQWAHGKFKFNSCISCRNAKRELVLGN